MNTVMIGYNIHPSTKKHGRFIMRIKADGTLVESIISHHVQELIDFLRKSYPYVKEIVWALVP
jgi:hypothetical protein